MPASNTPAPHPGKDSAWRALQKDAAVLVAGRLITALCGFAQVPIALQHLGPERFGVWIALSGVLWSIAGLDGGIGSALQNRIAAACAIGRTGEAAALVRRGHALLLRLALAAVPFAIAFLMWSDSVDWLHASTNSAEATFALALVLVTALLSLPASFQARIASAAQLSWLNGLWTGVSAVIALAIVVASAALDLGLPGLIFGPCVLALLPNLGTYSSLRRRLPWLKTPSAVVGLPPRLWRESLMFFLPQLGASFITSFTPVLVAVFAGPAWAGGYGVLHRLYGLLLQLQTLSLQPTWPAYTHAAARNDFSLARSIYLRSSAITAIGVAAVLALVVPHTGTLLRWWLRGDLPLLTPALVWAVATWQMAQCLVQPATMVLNGFGRIKITAVTSVVGVLVTLGVSDWAGERWGAVGIVFALLVPFAVLTLPIITWAAHATLRDVDHRRPRGHQES